MIRRRDSQRPPRALYCVSVKALATEFWWRIELFILVWANFLFLAILGLAFGGFFGNLNALFSLVLLWSKSFMFLTLPAAALGFASSLAWLRSHNRERAVALAILSGGAAGTYIVGLLLLRGQ